MRRVVVRFSEAELEALIAVADLAGSALAAWIGDAALRGARGGELSVVDLLRLHADVVGFASCTGQPGSDEVLRMLARLEGAVDAAVAEIEGRRR